MHADEVDIDVSLVSALIAAQCPQWNDLPLREIPSAGTEHTLYRLGHDKVVRMLRNGGALDQAERDSRWLPFLAPQLPLATSMPLAHGAPGLGYPYPWSVYQWLDGTNPTTCSPESAFALASYLQALHRIDTTGAPPARGRGGPLAPRDPDVREAIAALDGTIDTHAATEAWESALAAPEWDGPPLWIHGDLHAGNMLEHNGKLSAVIDYGCLCAGDPANDLMVAWTFLSTDTREVFRAALPFDDADWERGRGWALSMALIALPYYRFTNPVLAGISSRTIEQVLYPTARTR